MKVISSTVFTVIAFSVALTGCVVPPGGNSPSAQMEASCRVFGSKNQVGGAVLGTLLGAGLGALAGGSKGAMIGAGAGLVGGGLIGTAMDHRDCEIAQAALKQSLMNPNSPSTVPWTSPTNNSGLFNLQAPKTNPKTGQICREYTSTVNKSDGTSEQGTGVTCRNSNGDWDIQ